MLDVPFTKDISFINLYIMMLPTIVVDNGSGFIKAGYGGDTIPSTIFPTSIQYPTRTSLNVDTDEWKSVHNIGHAVDPDHPRGSLLRAHYPAEGGGILTDWEDMDNIWKHVFSELGATIPLSHPILMTEPTYPPRGQRQRLISYVFESLSAPAYYTALPALLSTYAANLPTALVIDSSFAATTTVPIYEHIPIRHYARRNDISGQAIDNWLQLVLSRETGLELPSNSAWEDAIRLLKSERCRVAGNFEKELLDWTRRREEEDGEVWELPDGRRVKLDRPLGLWAGEILLYPGILGLDTGGLQHDALNVVMGSDTSLREELYGNILLAGGNTMFPGFGNRLKSYLEDLADEGTNVKVISPRNRAYSAWVGGSMLSELSTFGSICISRDEYEETGPGVVNRKCL